MKKLTMVFIVLLVSLFSAFPTGMAVFDWSAFLQFSEEAMQTAERWKTQYNQIMRDIEQAEKTFAEFDPGNISSITGTFSKISNLADNTYAEINGSTSEELRKASNASKRLKDGFSSPYYRNNANYWIDFLQDYTVSDKDVSESYFDKVEKYYEQFRAVDDSTDDSMNYMGSQSNADRDAAAVSAIEKGNLQNQQDKAEKLKEEGEETADLLGQLIKCQATFRAVDAASKEATANFWQL